MKNSCQHRLAAWLALLCIMLEFLLSGRMLEAFGIPYEEEGGTLLIKLHPGTYLAMGAMLARLAGPGDPLRTVWLLIWRERALALYLGAILFCLLYEAFLTGPGGLILPLDTFLPAGMIGIALSDMNEMQARRLAFTLRALLLINATLAVMEAMTGVQAIPAETGVKPSDADYRSVALYDHPLTGAAATMIGLLLAPGARRERTASRAYQLCMFAALLSFGGRVALVLAIASAVGLHGWRAARKAVSRSLVPADFVPCFAVLCVALPLVWLASANGLTGRLQEHLYWDASAATRIGQFHLLGLLSAPQLLFGCGRADMIASLEPLRLAYGVGAVENFWLVMLIMLGALAFPIFVAGLAALAVWLWQRGDAEGRLMTVSLFLVASTSNSLGHKSPLLVMLVGSVLARARQSARFAAAA